MNSYFSDGKRSMKLRIGFLVILYNRAVSASETLNSLREHLASLRDCEVHLEIYNNGPVRTEMESTALVSALAAGGVVVKCREILNNRPLSVIYDKFLDKYHFDRYVLLDQDSKVTAEYLAALLRRRDSDLIVPLIVSHGMIQSPTIHNTAVHGATAVPADGLMGIGSGLALSRRLVEMMRERDGAVFDRHYALYGVDSIFFVKLRRLARSKKLLVHADGTIYHSLSRLEDESVEVRSFRGTERSYALGVTLRRYPEWGVVKHALTVLIDIFRGRSSMSASKMASGFLRGKHPRC